MLLFNNRTVCLLLATILLTQALPTTMLAEENVDKPRGLDPDVVVNYFANAALLYDRGIALWPGDAERLAEDMAVSNAQLRAYFEITDEQRSDFRQLKRRATTRGPQTREAKLAEWQARPQEPLRPFAQLAVALGVDFTPEQVAKAPLMCLNYEGLLALRRPEFRNLIGISEEKQQQVTKLANEASDQTLDIHRGRFTLRNDQLDLEPELVTALRRAACELDRDISSLLNNQEKSRLADLLVQAAADAKHIYGPEAGQSLEPLIPWNRKPEPIGK